MGYTFTIGEAKIFCDKDDLFLQIEAEETAHPDAPNYDKFNANRNSRSPSYKGWADFAKQTGLTELFYGQESGRGHSPCSDDFHRETPLLAEHPGVQVLCAGDLEVIKAAREKRQATNGGRPAGFWNDDGSDNGNDEQLARLKWLEFWVDWALKNCKVPVFQNT